MTTIYLVRHAAAAGNIERYFQGRIDGPLNEKGYKQLDALSERFKEIKLDAIISSPLKRAAETAGALKPGDDLEIKLDNRLVEINGGILEGVKWADIPVKYPALGESWSIHPWDFEPEGGESMAALMERMSSAMKDIAQKHDGETIAVVSHGCAIRAFLCSVVYGDILKLNDVNWSDNTAVSLLEYEDGAFSIVYLNDASHLDQSISTFATQRWWTESARGKMVFDD